MSNEPLVSVLINCYNGAKYLKEAIDSVYAQSYQNWEIILWDNCSTDETPQIAQSYDHKCRYFRGEKNVPLYEARNLALEKVQGEFIAVLDCDDLWLPNKLEKQIPLFENQKVGIVFSDTYFFNNYGILKRYYSNVEYFTGKCFKQLLGQYFLSLETVVFRKKALENLTYPFDPRFNMIGDADLFRRIGFTWELAMVDEVLAKWRVHDDNLTFLEPENFGNETKLMLKNYSQIFENFDHDYAKEIKALERDIAVCDAKILWNNGKASEARRLLSPFWPDKKASVYYMMSFFPKNWMNPLIARLSK